MFQQLDALWRLATSDGRGAGLHLGQRLLIGHERVRDGPFDRGRTGAGWKARGKRVAGKLQRHETAIARLSALVSGVSVC